MNSKATRPKIRLFAAILVICMIFSVTWERVAGQEEEPRQPVDLMVVIDNTCSNFPITEVAFGCSVFGSDPDFLRIRGANMLLARLGLGQPDEQEYQIGAISFGDEPQVVSPLTSVYLVRDSLAANLENPEPQENTRLVEALLESYRQLGRSQSADTAHTPAIVLISDGFPVPREGQSLEEIETIIAEHQEVQHFIILLRNADIFPDDFVKYVQFWQQMQRDYHNVFVYPLEDNTKIIDTYYEVISRLEEITPTNAFTLQPNLKLEVFIGDFVRRLVLTTINSADQASPNITITDPQGNQVQDNEAGVAHFKGEFNPVEVISIAGPRLSESLKDQYWTFVSDEEANVYLDRQGAYSFEFIEPKVDFPEIKNNFAAADTHNSNTNVRLAFRLIEEDGTPIGSPQPMRGRVLFSDGTERAMRIPYEVTPNDQGVFEVELDLEKDLPEVFGSEGFLTIVIEAGSVNPVGIDLVPIASARVLIELIPGPTIQSISPTTIKCYLGQAADISGRIEHYDTLDSESVSGRVYSADGEVALEINTNGEFSGDLTPLCEPLITQLACSTTLDSSFNLEISGQHAEKPQQIAINQTIGVEAVANACTPTPASPTITVVPTPTPEPTAIPDTDGDGLLDSVDQCAFQKGYEFLDGCPVTRGMILTGAAILAGFMILILILFFLIRRWRRRQHPPQGYIMACRKGNRVLEPTSIYDVGKRNRTHQVTIGSKGELAHIFVRNLKPVEFIVEERDQKTCIISAQSDRIIETFSALAAYPVETSQPDIVIWVSLSKKMLIELKC